MARQGIIAQPANGMAKRRRRTRENAAWSKPGFAARLNQTSIRPLRADSDRAEPLSRACPGHPRLYWRAAGKTSTPAPSAAWRREWIDPMGTHAGRPPMKRARMCR